MSAPSKNVVRVSLDL